MALSFFRKIQKILEKPEMPAHIRARQIQVEIPWHQRLWNSIRPPSATGEQNMNAAQRRLISLGLAGVVIVGSAAWGIKYMMDAPVRAAAAFDKGMDRVGPADFQGAVALFTESINIHETAQAYLERGNAQSNLGKTTEAVADWSRAIQLDPNLAPAFIARATHYRIAGNLPQALSDLDRALQIGASVDGFYQRGQVHDAMKEHQKAFNDYSDAIELRREAPYIYLARAAARQALGDLEGAHQDRATAQELQRAGYGR